MPITAPLSVSSACVAVSPWTTIRARPMSRILIVPFLSSSKLPSLMSRWITPSPCANSSPRCLQDVAGRFVDRQWAILLDQRREVAPFDVLHHQEMHAAGFIGIVGSHDVGMPQLGGGFHFTLEAGHGAASFIVLAGCVFTATNRGFERGSHRLSLKRQDSRSFISSPSVERKLARSDRIPRDILVGDNSPAWVV